MVMKGKGVGEKRRRTGKGENAKSFNPLSNEAQAERMQRVGRGSKKKKLRDGWIRKRNSVLSAVLLRHTWKSN
jgi:hypothetical protein